MRPQAEDDVTDAAASARDAAEFIADKEFLIRGLSDRRFEPLRHLSLHRLATRRSG
jgi:hypothetical protein